MQCLPGNVLDVVRVAVGSVLEEEAGDGGFCDGVDGGEEGLEEGAAGEAEGLQAVEDAYCFVVDRTAGEEKSGSGVGAAGAVDVGYQIQERSGGMADKTASSRGVAAEFGNGEEWVRCTALHLGRAPRSGLVEIATVDFVDEMGEGTSISDGPTGFDGVIGFDGALTFEPFDLIITGLKDEVIDLVLYLPR